MIAPRRLSRDGQEIVMAWMLTKMMPSQPAQAAPEMTPKPAARTIRPHNQVSPAPRGRARTDPVVGWLDVVSAPTIEPDLRNGRLHR